MYFLRWPWREQYGFWHMIREFSCLHRPQKWQFCRAHSSELLVCNACATILVTKPFSSSGGCSQEQSGLGTSACPEAVTEDDSEAPSRRPCKRFIIERAASAGSVEERRILRSNSTVFDEEGVAVDIVSQFLLLTKPRPSLVRPEERSPTASIYKRKEN